MYHTLILAGNLGKDPEQRFTPSGQAVTTFNVATNRNYTDANGQAKKEVTWFRVSVWGKQAESCYKYLKSGSKVIVEGRLIPDDSGNPRVYKRTDGSSAASFEVVASTVRFLSGKGEQTESVTEDDMPF